MDNSLNKNMLDKIEDILLFALTLAALVFIIAYWL